LVMSFFDVVPGCMVLTVAPADCEVRAWFHSVALVGRAGTRAPDRPVGGSLALWSTTSLAADLCSPSLERPQPAAG